LLNRLNEKQLGKMSIILQPGANSGLSGSKEGKTLLKQLSISTTEYYKTRKCDTTQDI